MPSLVMRPEARFEVYRRDGRIRVRRRREELYHESSIMPRAHSGGVGVTIWCAFHDCGKNDVVVLDRNLGSTSVQTHFGDNADPIC